jgi:hypothetical protein
MPAESGNHPHKRMEWFLKKKMTGGSEYFISSLRREFCFGGAATTP